MISFVMLWRLKIIRCSVYNDFWNFCNGENSGYDNTLRVIISKIHGIDSLAILIIVCRE